LTTILALKREKIHLKMLPKPAETFGLTLFPFLNFNAVNYIQSSQIKRTQQHNLNLLESVMKKFARRWSEKSLQGTSIPPRRLLYLGR
jgi:hypothetical protein